MAVATLPRTRAMNALIFRGPGRIELGEVPVPRPGPGEAVIRVTLTTICGTDLHILRGEYPVKPGLIIGHEAVGTVYELGPGVTGYNIGDRVLVGAITPCGQCYRRWAAGVLGIPSMAHRLSTCWSHMRRPTWPRFPAIFAMNRCSCSPTSLPPVFPPPKALI